MTYVLLALAFLSGVLFRERIGDSFRFLYRGQAAMLGAPLALLAGWSFVSRPTSVGVIAVLLLAELGAVSVGLWLLQRGRISPVTAVAATSNSGFWSTPIAGALFGAPGTAFAVVYDIVGAIRPFIIVRTLRKRAPETPSRRTALIDYLPAVALFVGLGLQFIRPVPPPAEAALPWLALLLGGLGFFALGAAMPDRFPKRSDFAAGAPVIPLRFVLPFGAMLLLRGAGVDVPGGAWVIALAPNAFMVIAMARLYGYDRRKAAAITLLAVPIAAALVPLAAWLGK